jgi:two-component sensor histidine kinase
MNPDTVEKADAALQLLTALQTCIQQLPPSALLQETLRSLRIAVTECRAAAVESCEQHKTVARTEARLRAAVADKELLLHEIHHRTRNNFQILDSLLELQADSTSSPEARRAIAECQHRVSAMTRLHDQLYQSLASGRIRIAEYLRTLAEALSSSYGAPVTVAAPDVEIALDPDRAMACGLVANELLTNAFKYARPAGQAIEIGLGFHADRSMYHLRVWDTGVGLPASVDLDNAPSLGLRLVRLLAIKLQASVRIDRRHGTSFTLSFPILAPAQPTKDA